MKKLVLFLSFAFALVVNAQNLIKDPEINNEKLVPEFRICENPRQGALTQYIEDSTWNRCLKLELKEYHTDKDGNKTVNLGVMFGGDKDAAGFPCEPDKTYRFSAEVKGQASRAMFNFCEWNADKKRKKGRTSIHQIHPQKEWSVYKGTFKTGSTAKRAALMLQFWGTEKNNQLQEKIGDYLLIDKIVVEEVTESVITSGKAEAIEVKSLSTYVASSRDWNNVPMAGNFKVLRTGMDAVIPTEFQIKTNDKAIILKIKCHDPKPNEIKSVSKATGESNIWKDDIIEIFFDSITPDRRLNQFVVSAGGGRWMSHGGVAKVNTYDAWNALSKITADGWEAEIVIPFKILGYDSHPKDGEMIRFNICRQRPASAELSTFSFQPANFHDISCFGILFFGTMKPYADKIISSAAEYTKEPSISKLINRIDLSVPSQAMGTLETLKNQIRLQKLSREKFILAAIPPTTDPAIPFLPRQLNEENPKIKLRAAINEQAPLALALGNMTDLSEEYRITVTAGWRRLHPQDERHTDEPGLRNGNELFPPEKIIIRRGVAFKDSELETRGRRYDILTTLNEVSSIPVPPREGGLIWINFDCRNLKPGTYRGYITIIPFNQRNISFKHSRDGYTVTGGHKRYELELEILPIPLPETSPMPFNPYRTAWRDSTFNFMNEHDSFMYMVTPWFFTFKFRPDGSVEELTTREWLNPHLELLVKKLRETGLKADPKIMIGYNAYPIFKRIIVPKDIPYDSEAYWNAWRNWCHGLDSIMKKHGLTNEEYTVEIFDEPRVNKDTYQEIVKAHAEARKAVPAMQQLMTSGLPASQSNEPYFESYFNEISKLLDQWIFTYYLTQNKHRKYMKIYQQMPGKKSSVYACGTNMRQDLYRYYRMLPWYALEANCDFVSLFQMFEQTIAADFYKAPEGGVAYMLPDSLVPSIRLEALRLGQTDIKYMKLLETLATGDSATAKSARDFLKKSPYEMVVVKNHDVTIADNIRNKAIEYILLLQQEQ